MTNVRLPTWLGIALLAGAAQASEPATALAVPGSDRLVANQEFRDAFDAGRYADALPAATRVVEITRSQFGNEAPELVNPLTNLGTTHYRLKQYEPALDTYRAALAVLETDADSANPRLVAPLHGLGLALRALDRKDEAIVPLQRAVDILRNREGLFTPKQLPLLQPLGDAYMAARRTEEAGTIEQYALTVGETAWGKSDIRLLPQLDAYARWNEAAGRFAAARLLHERSLQIAGRQMADGHVLAIPGLRGIARSYRFGYMHGETEQAIATGLGSSTTDAMMVRAMSGPSPAGEQALLRALQLMQGLAPDDATLRGEVLTDLGDWYLTAGTLSRAKAAYHDAWTSLEAAGAAQQLAMPVPITYLPPSVSVSRGTEDPARFEERDIDFVVSVDADGEVREASVRDPDSATESAARSVASALRRSRFRPAVIDGELVAKTDVPFRERVYVKIEEAPAKP